MVLVLETPQATAGLHEELARIYHAAGRPVLKDASGGLFDILDAPERLRAEPGFSLVIGRSDDRVVGFALATDLPYGWWRDGGLPAHEDVPGATDATFAVRLVAVRPEWRRRGLGRRLVARIRPQHADWGLSWVHSSSSAAIGAFERWGWYRVDEQQPTAFTVLAKPFRALVEGRGVRFHLR